MATPFELDRGTHQGRVEGGYELGHADRLDAYLEVGDEHEVSQEFTITGGSKVVRAVVAVRTPDRLPDGMTWEFSMLLNGAEHYVRALDVAGRTLVLRPVVRLAGAPSPSTVALRLRLV